MQTKGALTTILALGLALSGCSPQVYYMGLETRHPSPYGMDLSGKSLSVVYVDDPSGRDSLFNHALAESFAKGLERDYFGGREEVHLYRMTRTKGATYADKDTLVNLVLDSGDDVVFLFDSPRFEDVVQGHAQPSNLAAADSAMIVNLSGKYSVDLYVYDSMDKADTVRTLKGSSTARVPVFASAGEDPATTAGKFWGGLGPQGVATGRKSAEKFSPVWKQESFPIFYYDSQKWLDAVEAAHDFKWHDAMDLWMQLATSTSNPDKRAYAEHNMAVAMYVLGDDGLATQWIDLAIKDKALDESKAVKKMIDSRRNPVQSAPAQRRPRTAASSAPAGTVR